MFRLVIHRLILKTKTNSEQVFNGIFLAIFHDSWLQNTEEHIYCSLFNHTRQEYSIYAFVKRCKHLGGEYFGAAHFALYIVVQSR